jgi:hypothetical protein
VAADNGFLRVAFSAAGQLFARAHIALDDALHDALGRHGGARRGGQGGEGFRRFLLVVFLVGDE